MTIRHGESHTITELSTYMPCTLCHGHGHNRRTCSSHIPSDSYQFPGNPWVYDGHELDEEDIQERIRRFHYDMGVRLAHERPVIYEPQPYMEDLIVSPLMDTPETREVTLVNLGKTEYTLYWVNGNHLIMSLDDHIHEVVMQPDTLSENQHLTLRVRDGFRYYLLPTYMRDRGGASYTHHTQMDDVNIKYDRISNSLGILTLDIHEGIQGRVFASEQGWDLSETHQWKFHALKLNYLLQQVIKLGGMANDNLAPVLDLHQDIHLPAHSEVDKEYAGIPSEFTNLT